MQITTIDPLCIKHCKKKECAKCQECTNLYCSRPESKCLCDNNTDSSNIVLTGSQSNKWSGQITPGIHVPSIPLNLSLKRMEPAAILKIDRTIPDPNLIDISLAELAKINRVLDITSDKMKINLKIKHTALMI